ncbi:uncharacterized protein [Antedon mediterranea]|uniref:uncharacterized protein n=1 Tax=Antedon mediterranea TaxID=105859 RepID=UPI003AF423A1
MAGDGQYIRFVFVVILFPVVLVAQDCQYGLYKSEVSSGFKCCVPCKTWDLYYLYRTADCQIEPNVCMSDTGIRSEAEYYGPDRLKENADPAILNCPISSQFIFNCDKGKNFTVTLVDFKLNTTHEGDIKDLVCTYPPGSILELGSNTVECTAQDSIKSNRLHCNFTVTVIDKEKPQIQCQILKLNTTIGKNCSNVTYYDSIHVEDNSGMLPEVNCSIPHRVLLLIGQHNVTCTAVDNSFNINYCYSQVLVEDNERPQLICHNKTVTTITGKNYSNSSTFETTAWDNSMKLLQPTCNMTENLSIGQHVIRCNVSDNSLNSNECFGVITVEDNEKPELECKDQNFTTDAGSKYANVTFKLPDCSDNSGERLVPNCTVQPGSRLKVGTHALTCSVHDSSLNMNTCSAKITVQEFQDSSGSKLSVIIPIPIILILVLLMVAVSYYYCKLRRRKTCDTRAVFNGNGEVTIETGSWLVFENIGATFVDVKLSISNMSHDFEAVTLTWTSKRNQSIHGHKTIEKKDYNMTQTISKLLADTTYKFKLKELGTEKKIKTQKNLSKLFECKIQCVMYDSFEVDYKCNRDATDLSLNNVWLDVQEVGSSVSEYSEESEPDGHFDVKVNDRKDHGVYKFEGLKPGHKYNVMVEIRTLNNATISDPHNIGCEITTKRVSISPDVSCTNVVVHFSGLETGYKPFVKSCCGKSTVSENIVNICNLQPGSIYMFSYGVVHQGKHLHQGYQNVLTKTTNKADPVKLDEIPRCKDGILKLFDRRKSECNRVTSEMKNSDCFYTMLATSLEFRDSFSVLKKQISALWNTTFFNGFIYSMHIHCDTMSVHEFLKLFFNELSLTEYDKHIENTETVRLLKSEDDIKILEFVSIIAEDHSECLECQKIFHSHLHSKGYVISYTES